MKKLILGFSSAAIGLALLVAPTFAANTTVVVRPNNMQGWAFINDQTNGPGSGALVNGPAIPPLGVGSAQLTVTGPSDGQILVLGQLGGTKLSDLTSLTYWTYQNPGNTSNNTAIALQFNVVSDVTAPSPSWQGRIVYEPYYNNGGTVPLGQWKEWDALNAGNGLWWFSGPSHFGDNCPQSSPCTWSHILSLYPNIGINPIYPGIVFKAGSGWAAFSGNVDDFTIGVSGNNTNYDFESACTPVTTLTKGTLTAAVVTNSGDTVSGNVDATGCDIGVYVPVGASNVTVTGDVHDANQYGVFNDGNVTVNGSHIYSIGNHTGGTFDPNGDQTGVGVYFEYTSNATGTVENATVDQYQKGGIVINSGNATVLNNTVTGLTQVSFIAQNGIQFAYGAQGEARGNTIDGNWYTGAGWTSTGMLLFDVNANQVKTSNNKYENNQTNHAIVTSQACPHQYGGFYENYGLCPF